MGTPQGSRGTLRWAGLALAVSLLGVHMVTLGAPEILGSLTAHRGGGVLFLVGGPACLAIMGFISLRWPRVAGAGLWLGAAATAIGLSLEAGPRFLWYILGMLLWVLPQAVAGTLLLVGSRQAVTPKKSRPRPKIPGI